MTDTEAAPPMPDVALLWARADEAEAWVGEQDALGGIAAGDWDDFLADRARAFRAGQAHERRADLQPGVDKWMDACFGETIKADRLERADRFVEEALELAQTMPGFGADRAHALVDYVFGRDVGERSQEVGGVMVTLAALCNAAGLDMNACAETELARVWTKVDAIRAKQAAKPTGSALPVAHERRADAGLLAALEPFAKAGDLFAKYENGNRDALIYAPAAGKEYYLDSGHLLDARAAIAAAKGHDHAE